MGQTGSNVAKKVMSPFTGWSMGKEAVPPPTGSNGEKMAVTVSPFVFTRRGSMFFDDDGDLAHEFYEETCDKRSKKRRMRRLRYNLQAQGDVDLPHPRIHWDFPIIMCEATR